MRWFGITTFGFGVLAVACGGESLSGLGGSGAGGSGGGSPSGGHSATGGSSAGKGGSAAHGTGGSAAHGMGGSAAHGMGGSAAHGVGGSNLGGSGGGHPSSGGAGGTGGIVNQGGDAGIANGATGAVNEAGAAGAGETGGTGGLGEGGATSVTCDPGYTTCPGSEECSTRLAVGIPSDGTVANCGACGRICSLANATSAMCNAGACQPACAANFADCNATTANDGCETSVTTVTNCGGCGRQCSSAGATVQACTGGLCAPTCAAKYADCARDSGAGADDGCETYLDELTACGAACSGRVACDPLKVCNSGACVSADGLVKMSIPFTSSGQAQRYADKFTISPSLTGSTLTLRAYAPGATSGYMNAYLVDYGFSQGPTTVTQFTTLSAGWTDVVVQSAPASGIFDASKVYEVVCEFYANGSGPWANPTVIYLDGVRSSNGAVNDTFDTSSGTMVASALLVVSGSSFGWAAAVP